MKSTPLPNWLVLGNSAIIICISAAFLGVAVGMLSVTWNICSMFGGLVLLPLPLAVGSLQYVAGFRRNARAASLVAIIHLIGCALIGVACFAIITEGIAEGHSVTPDICAILTIVLTISVYCGFCGWMNLRLAKYLRAAASETQTIDGAVVGRFQFTLRELLAGVLVVAITASMAGYCIRSAGKQYQEHINREDASVHIAGLPEGATDVCYCHGQRGIIVYEFTIDEEVFLDWANDKRENLCLNPDSPMKEIQKGGPFTVRNYAGLMPDEVSSSSYGDNVTIPQGYYYANYLGDNGYELGYDTATHRAYYYRYYH